MPLFFALTLFMSATLLFLVQPMVGRMVLPMLGGTPAVWNTCMVFYQTLLLLGYLYAHVVTTRVPARKQVKIHLMVLAVPLIGMIIATILTYKHSPIAVLSSLSPQGSDYPVFGVLGLLTIAIALPFFAVSTSAPLLQKWFAETGHPSSKDPYFLYGASNVGSLLALLAYPLIVETTLPSITQAWLWMFLYAGLVFMVYRCGTMLWAATDPAKHPQPTGVQLKTTTSLIPVDTGPAPTWATRMYWLGLAFVPSSLMLGVTTHITTDIASLPLLWVIPLAMYLITFIIAFSRTPPWFMMSITLIAPVLILLLLFMMASKTEPRYSIQILLHLVTFFAVALVCHSELARNRPSTKWLTEFYLWMSVGGMMGGLFNAMFAPLVFNMIHEYRITLVIACLLLPKLTPDVDGAPSYPRWINLVIGGLFLFLGFREIGWIGFIDTSESVRDMRNWVGENIGTGAMIFLDLLAVLAPVAVWAVGLYLIYRLLRRSKVGQSMWISPALDLLLPLCVLGLSRFLIGWENHFQESKALDTVSKGLGLQAKMLLTVAVYGLPAMMCYFFVERPLRFGLSVAALAISLYTTDQNESRATVFRERSFFGVLKVDSYATQNRLVHGTTLHGTQWKNHYEFCVASMLLPLGGSNVLDVSNVLLGVEYVEALGREPWKFPGRDPLTYYHRSGPVGSLMENVDDRHPEARIAVVGLGTGSMSCYAKKGQSLTFFEIDASVVRLVEREYGKEDTYFNFLDLAKKQGANIDIVLGDARIKIEEMNEQGDVPKYDVMLIDAFSSDAIPVHLLTREALKAYFDRTTDDGIVALHISNRHLDLEPVVDAIAKADGYAARVMNDGEDSELFPGKTASSWIVVAKDEKSFGKMLDDPRWKKLTGRSYVSAWTDDFSSLLKILRFKEVKAVRKWLGMYDKSEDE